MPWLEGRYVAYRPPCVTELEAILARMDPAPKPGRIIFSADLPPDQHEAKYGILPACPWCPRENIVRTRPDQTTCGLVACSSKQAARSARKHGFQKALREKMRRAAAKASAQIERAANA